MFRSDSIMGFSAQDHFGLPQKAGHRLRERSFQGTSDPLGIDAEFSFHFLMRSISSSFCIGLLEACLLGNWVTVSSWALNTKD